MPIVTAQGPGRVNLIGEHTDHTDGLAMPLAIGQGVAVRGEPTGDGRIRLSSDAFPDAVDVAADGSELPADGWGRYVAAVAREVTALGRPPIGFHGAVASTLPAGIGLSSSAALEVAVATALLRAATAAGHALERVGGVDLALALQRAEHLAVGVPSGVLDQAASLLGVHGGAIVLDCKDLSVTPAPLPPDFPAR